MFTILDGRKEFYQWDLDRKLVVEDSSIKEVHFCNRTDECSLVVETYTEDGLTLADVPNVLLQSDWRINVYAYDGKATKHSATFGVVSRTKPSDYVYTETEVKRYEDLENRIESLEQNGGNIDTEEFVKKTDYAGANKAGIAHTNTSWGIGANSTGGLYIVEAPKASIDAKDSHYNPITPANLEYAVTSVGDRIYERKCSFNLTYNEEEGCYYCETTGSKLYNLIQQGYAVKLYSPVDKYYYFPVYADEYGAHFMHLSENYDAKVIMVGDNGKALVYEKPLVSYNDNGNLISNEPILDWEVATKGYVDNAPKQKKYELIESFTLQADTVLERTQEPDGTPYKLERVLIKASAISDTYTFFTATVQSNGTNIAYLFHNFTANQNGREYGITEAFQECGYWRSINHIQNHQAHVYSYVRYGGTDYTVKHAVSKYPYITRIFGAGALPCDVEVEIWGVRADA